MTRMTSEGIGAFYQFYPKMALVVTCQHQGKPNAMAAAWHCSLSFNPPLYGVAVAPKRFSYRVITESKQFGVNFLPFAKAEVIAAVGGSSGAVLDKFEAFDIPTEKPIRTQVPVLKDAYAAYECELLEDREYGDHHWLVGRVVATHWQKEAFNEEEVLDLSRIKPTLYLGNEFYLTAARDTVRQLPREVYGRHKPA